MEKKAPKVTNLSFIDNLGFIIRAKKVGDIINTLQKVSDIIIEWGTRNAVSFDIKKTKAVLFTKA